MKKYALGAVTIGVLMSCSDLPTASLPVQVSPPSNMSRNLANVPIPGSYIVLFKDGTSTLKDAMRVQSQYGAVVEQVYTSAINGAAMQLTADAADALRADPSVASVEQNVQFRLSSTTQLGATWGLDRIDQRARPLGGSYVYGANGAGVTVYILDTGINFGQADFGGRAQTGYDAITPGGTAADCEGHGSHVAGTVGSTTYGVAKGVRLVAVRVLNCVGNGNSASVLAGIDWVKKNRSGPAVVNMSIGAGFSLSVNLAVQNSIAAGITFVVSAGNASADACWQSPAAAPDAITVAATDGSDGFAGFSNYGTCVDILAPGTNITSWWTGAGANTLSGTSMSTPHVAGAAALYLQMNPTATPAQVHAALIGNATSGIIGGLPTGTPNLMLYTGFLGGGPPPTPPVASFTVNCTVLTCSFDASGSTSSVSTPSYQWNFGDASNGTGATATHKYATGGTFPVTLTVTDPNGTDTQTSNVVLNRAPTAAIVTPANNASFKEDAAVLFAGTGLDPEDGVLSGASLVWTSSRDGVIGTGLTLSTGTLSIGSHVVTLTATDAQKATDTASVTITITPNQPPTATIVTPLNNAVSPLGANVLFTGTGTDPEDGLLLGASLVWTSSRDGQIGTGISTSSTGLTAGVHTITLTSTDSKGLTGFSTRTITIAGNQAPTAAIVLPLNNTTSAQGVSVTFVGTGADPEDGVLSGLALVWTSSRDGQIGTGLTFTRRALTIGTHIITLTARDTKGATDIASVTLTITAAANQAPSAAMSSPSNNASFPFGASVNFVGMGSDHEDGTLSGASLVWTSSRDGQIGTGTTFSKANLTAGTHSITITAKDSKGATTSITRTITIGAAPNQSPAATITAPANGAVVVQGTSVTFTGGGTDPEDGPLTGASLVWASSEDGQIGTGTTFAKNNLSIGTHTITLTATDSKGATDVESRTLTINAPVNLKPAATITAPANNAAVVQGASVTFTGSGADPEDGALTGGSLVWSSSRDGQIGTGTTFARNNLSIGTHTITLMATDSKGATDVESRTLTINAPVNQLPTATIAAPANNAAFPFGANVTFTGSANDPEDGALSGASLVWKSSRDGQIGTGASFSTNDLTAGTHTITLTAKDSKGATDIDTRSVTIVPNQAPAAAISAPASNAVIVQGANVTFTGSGADPEDGTLTGGSLVWTSSRDGQIGTGTTFARNNLSLGTHTITLTATDSKGATDVESRTITVNAPVNQLPTATIASPANNAVFLVGANVTFSGSATDPEDGPLSGGSLVWTSNRDGQIGTGGSFSTNDLIAGAHTITLTAKDSKGATDIATISLTINIPVNQAPSASIVAPANYASVAPGASVTFSGTGSDAEDGTLSGASLVWTSSIDGQIGTGTWFAKSNLSAGTHTITLTVKDSKGLTDSDARTLTVGVNRTPTATIISPSGFSTAAQGVALTFVGAGSDPDDGPLSGLSLVWTSSRDGQIGTGTTLTKNNLSVGVHTITLTVKDGKGATASAARVITISSNQPPAARFVVTCATLQCTFDASTSTDDTGITQYTFDWGDGSTTVSSTPIVQHSYAAADSYTVTLMVRDTKGALQGITRLIVVQ